MKKSMLKSISFLTAIFILFCFIPFKAAETNAYNTLKYGIDVSSYQGDIDWDSLGKANIDFAIIRTGTTNFNDENMKTDSYFIQNYSGAKSNGIKTGAYYFTSAFTRAGMIQNAYDCLNTLGGRTLDYPIFIDIENDAKSTMQVSLGKAVLTDYLLEALKILSDAGYKAGIYSNKSFLESYVDTERIKSAGFYIWMAQYPSGSYAVNPIGYDKSGQCSMWQYSDRGAVSGVNGNCDVDVCYTDFEPVPEPDGEKYIVATENSNLNIRSEANIGDNIIGKAPKDAVVTMLQLSDDGSWAKVYYNGITGYCSMQYLKKIVSEPEEPVVPVEPEVPEEPEIPEEPADTQMLIATTKEVNLNIYSEPDKTVVFVYQNIPDSVKAVNMAYSISGDDIVELVWGDWNANTLPLNISGKKCGETDIIVSLKNLDTDEVLETVTIHVAVKDELPMLISESYENPDAILSDIRLDINSDNKVSGYIIVDKTYPSGMISCSADENSVVEIEMIEGVSLDSEKRFFKLNFYPKKMGKEKIAFNYMINGSSISVAYIDVEVYGNKEIRGDANEDGKITIADAVMLQKWLSGTGELSCWTNVDLCEDGKIDIFDMIEMRKILIDISSQSAQQRVDIF